MVTFLITSFFVLAFLAIAIYFWQKRASSVEAGPLLPPPGRGLFIDGTSEGQALITAQAESEATKSAAAKRLALVERALAGDKSSLLDARHLENGEHYQEVLNLLVARADSEQALLSLVSYITRNDLPVNRKLAEKFIDSCKRVPGRSTTAKLLHVAALADDAEVYQSAVETTLELWRGGYLPEISPQELRTILEGEFWILSAPTRSSGAGFLLKRTLQGARRELEAAHND